MSPDPSCVGCIYAPVSTALAPNVFMQLPSSGTLIDIELTGISAGDATAGTAVCSSLTVTQLTTSGTYCTPAANSPFILQNVFDAATGQINTNVDFSASGLAWYVATPAQTSAAAINFSTSFTDQNIAEVLSTIQTTGEIVSSLQGDVVVNAPEPMTFALIGAGLAGLGLLKRRKSLS